MESSMFGYVNVNWKELPQERQQRFGAVYCGVCRRIRIQSGQLSRLGLQYDAAFLGLLLMSLYEPAEVSGSNACLPHPISKRPWVDNDCIAYAADMNVALAYYKCLDDWQDDRSQTARIMLGIFGARMPRITKTYPRQCGAIADCITEISRLEKQRCDNPDLPANCFGNLMGELLVWKEDIWSDTLREMGYHLGRFIYLLDAAVDFTRDKKHRKYNPFLAMGMQKEDWSRWTDYLVLTMARCTECFERLPLVQDKDILDNILYSGIWLGCRGTKKEEDRADDHGSV
jgi:hypothetical protein